MSARRDPRSVFQELLATVPPPRTQGERAARAKPPRRASRAGPRERGAAELDPRTLRAIVADAAPAPEARCSFTLPRDAVDAFRARCAEQGVAPRRALELLLRAYVAHPTAAAR